MTKKPTAEELTAAQRIRELLEYNPLTGIISWKDTSAGCVSQDGYILIGVDGKRLLGHRIAYLLTHGVWPPKGKNIDHANGIRSDNRLDNLRLADQSQNAFNSKLNKKNTSGYKGVSPRRGKWVASIMVGGKTFNLGLFSTAEEAHEVYKAAAEKACGAFANATKNELILKFPKRRV